MNSDIQNIQNYNILQSIGKGAYGLVYKIQWKSDNKIFAIKVIQIGDMERKKIKNTLNEIWILCSIKH